MPTTSKRRRQALEIPLQLDRSAGNQSRQVHASLRAAILDGRLAAGLRLPSSRALADQLGIRRNAIVVAFEHLESDGLVETRLGAGTYVAAHLPPRSETPEAAPHRVAEVRHGAFALGQTRADPILLRRLAGVMRRRIATATGTELGYGDPRGSEALRRQIAAQLAANRGILCDPSHILVVSGVQQGLRLCMEALLRPGDAVWMEDPGYPVARRTLEAAGARLVPVPVDGEGLDVAAGRRRANAAAAAYVTPSNQFPTGVTMSMGRRIALLDWARASQAWVFEDDYDNEFRYAGPPLTALAGLGGGDRIIYFGTFSKMLFPGLRLAYVVLPPGAVERVVAARSAFDRFPPSLAEGAVAELLADGTLAAHTRRMRARYRAARDAVAETLRHASGGRLDIVVPAQGLHLLANLPADLPGDAAARIREQAGIEAWLLAETRMVQASPDGFILGFAGHELAALTAAAERLGRAVRAPLASPM
ncbi:MAG: PLP-dependent aminotransferase family protein [Phreatobacter sp.]